MNKQILESQPSAIFFCLTPPFQVRSAYGKPELLQIVAGIVSTGAYCYSAARKPSQGKLF